MAGYSPRTLSQKLGIKEGMRVALEHAPAGYDVTLGELPPGVEQTTVAAGRLDFVQAFFAERAALEREFPRLKKALVESGMLWISWPKRAAKAATDLDENVVREIGLAQGLVDVKVCAVDERWSGLKFVVRLKDRKG